jgi:hypothetical protein
MRATTTRSIDGKVEKQTGEKKRYSSGDGLFRSEAWKNNISPYSATKTSSRRQASGRYGGGTVLAEPVSTMIVVRETLGGNTVLTPRARTSKGSASEVLCSCRAK